MLKPSLRLFILPLGAVCTIAALASQNAPQASQHPAMQTRQEIVSCSTKPNADVCILSESVAR
ncbi:hypothetical protein X566_11075 [Afipia sp. P52-10]|jgi:hypothetical protein|uniref:hypothetical protein n=1 Tax=Afipia sp. P52-10 TaxID=1429916 RepID=UPI0003DF4064|nr:hypothetical protein [Afipia sp. P52-10]ETR79068.1 hypothetical protein X566_11075 [Afipia sp. P52-10]